jgi:cation:H+ antiporter
MPNYMLPLLGIVFSMLVLTTLSAVLSKFAIRLGQYIRIPDVIIAVVILGLVGSFGELNMGITALIVDYQELILGLVISVGISMILLVGGVSIIYNKGIPTTTLTHSKALPLLNITVLAFILLVADQGLSRTDGVILLSFFPIYILYMLRLKKGLQVKSFKSLHSKKEALTALIICILVMINIFLTAGFAMQNIYTLEATTQISLYIIGIVLVAPFSVIPELIAELELSKTGTSKTSLSDLVMSIVTNLTLVIGLVALIKPFDITGTSSILNFNLFYLALVIIVFNIYTLTGKKLDIKEGIGMLVLYFVYLVLNFVLVAA